MAQVSLYVREAGSARLRGVTESADQLLASQIEGTLATRSLHADAAAITANLATGVNVATVNLGAAGSTVTIPGNLTVNGTTTTINTTNLAVSDTVIILAAGAAVGDEAGVAFERGATGDDAMLLWNEADSRFELGFFDTVGGTAAPVGSLAVKASLAMGSMVTDSITLDVANADVVITRSAAKEIRLGPADGTAHWSFDGQNGRIEYVVPGIHATQPLWQLDGGPAFKLGSAGSVQWSTATTVTTTDLTLDRAAAGWLGVDGAAFDAGIYVYNAAGASTLILDSDASGGAVATFYLSTGPAIKTRVGAVSGVELSSDTLIQWNTATNMTGGHDLSISRTAAQELTFKGTGTSSIAMDFQNGIFQFFAGGAVEKFRIDSNGEIYVPSTGTLTWTNTASSLTGAQDTQLRRTGVATLTLDDAALGTSATLNVGNTSYYSTISSGYQSIAASSVEKARLITSGALKGRYYASDMNVIWSSTTASSVVTGDVGLKRGGAGILDLWTPDASADAQLRVYDSAAAAYSSLTHDGTDGALDLASGSGTVLVHGVSGHLYLQASVARTVRLHVNGGTTIGWQVNASGDFLPLQTGYDIGNTTYEIDQIYATGLQLGAAQEAVLSAGAAGILQIGDSANDSAIHLLDAAGNADGKVYLHSSGWLTLDSPTYIHNYINGVFKTRLTTNALEPATAGTLDLGSTAVEWDQIYAMGLRLGAAQQVYLVESASYAILNGSAVQLSTSGIGRLVLSNTQFFPLTPGAIDLGATTNEYNDCFLSGSLQLGAAQESQISAGAAGVTVFGDSANDTALHILDAAGNPDGKIYLQSSGELTVDAAIGTNGSLANLGTQNYRWSATAFHPTSSNSKSLGASNRVWGVVYTDWVYLGSAQQHHTRGGGDIALTDATPIVFADVACAAGEMAGGTFECTVKATDGTDMQCCTIVGTYNIVNKAGAYTSQVAITQTTVAESAGTLTCAVDLNAGTNEMELRVTPTSSLTTTAYLANYKVTSNGQGITGK
jgi:ribosomal protein S11